MGTIPHLVLANAKRLRDEPALIHRVGRVWETMTWGDYGAAVERTAGALIASGIEPGDRVAILSYNTPEWVIFDVAAMAVGAVPVGIYFSSSHEGVADVIERSGARIVLVQTPAQVATIEPAAHTALDLVICTDESPGDAVSWDSFLKRANTADPGEVASRLESLQPEDPATIIFTAAGHGTPVGVVLSHDNLVAASHSSVDLFDVAQDDSALSYLPLSHVAEQIFTILAPAQVGYSVAFAQSIGRMRVDLLDIQPTIFFGVPLVWSGFERALRRQIGELGGAKALIADWAMRTARADIEDRNVGRRSHIRRLKMVVARRLFINRARRAMGLANTVLAFSGAVSIDIATLEYFSGFDLPIREVYGLSESTGPAVITREGANRFGAVGQPMPGVEMSLSEDSEILLGGRSVFLRYLDDEPATRHALRDGWLHTGDFGSIGADGQLTITGRKKEIIITSGGKNIDAGSIEPLLRLDDAIVDAIVVGDGYDQLGVLVAVSDGFDDDREAALAHVESVVKDLNQRFAKSEQIRRVGLLPRCLSVEMGEVSQSGAMQRLTVIERFADEIEALYV